ncbi:MAG: NAD(P)(+) transhydrogenase (Re/Si-specific) subunit alpha [Rhodospirillaceae bacterium]|nr:NAD(P)(+) transhydrogenase (Re/Si-specific) subunit alpha [Rhodospirillaceae bacterium]|tara:strand:+ start:311 stop:1471 length:1161 start_codon:yes stop_codon:yes gene_type:complete
MKIGVLKELRSGENRISVTPETIKKFKGLGCEVIVEKGAGKCAYFSDILIQKAGAIIADSANDVTKSADIILKVSPPIMSDDGINEVTLFKEGTILISALQATTNDTLMKSIANQGIIAFAMELMPRISRAQSMDILSSQSNLSGYRAVIDAAGVFGRAIPMMMTAAGTIAPARVVVFGAGVAGLQAIATAKRMGAIVLATDVRYAAKEQVESLGGKFIVVDEEAMKAAETDGGYAKEMSKEFYDKQTAAVAGEVAKADIVITTALIPGKKAPVLVTAEMIAAMKAGSVIVDLAGESGGNVEGSKLNETIVTDNEVSLLAPENMPSRLARDASALYAKNLYNFLSPMINKDTSELSIDWEDELISGTLITKDGKIVHELLNRDGAE